MGKFPVRFERQETLSRLLLAMVAGLASMGDKPRANFTMDSRSCPFNRSRSLLGAVAPVMYLLQSHEFFFCDSMRNGLASDNASHRVCSAFIHSRLDSIPYPFSFETQ